MGYNGSCCSNILLLNMRKEWSAVEIIHCGLAHMCLQGGTDILNIFKEINIPGFPHFFGRDRKYSGVFFLIPPNKVSQSLHKLPIIDATFRLTRVTL